MKSERWVKENLEAIAIAVVMALVIRQFSTEAFKIPTESMAPTLFGDRLGGTGDRILVDKVGYLLGRPSRFDIVVFKYPLDETENYIKRLVGLPGETLTIRDGDLWIDGKIARKPESVQDDLFFEVYPGPGPGSERERERAATSRWSLPGGSWRRIEGGFEVRAPERESLAEYGPRITDAYPWRAEGYGPHEVGDVRLSFEVTPRAGRVLAEIVDNARLHRLVLAVGEGRSFVLSGGVRLDLPGVVLPPGKASEVSFANVDDALLLGIAGKEFRFEYTGPEDIDHTRDAVRFGVENGEASFTGIRLYRDVYWVDEGVCEGVKIPPGHYFMLGDNSRDSKDSRKWNVHVVEMKDGTTYRYTFALHDGLRNRRPGPGRGTWSFRDCRGIMHTIRRADIRREYEVDAPFVPAANLIGKAFFVFWPINPFARNRFRMRFLH